MVVFVVAADACRRGRHRSLSCHDASQKRDGDLARGLVLKMLGGLHVKEAGGRIAPVQDEQPVDQIDLDLIHLPIDQEDGCPCPVSPVKPANISSSSPAAAIVNTETERQAAREIEAVGRNVSEEK